MASRSRKRRPADQAGGAEPRRRARPRPAATGVADEAPAAATPAPPELTAEELALLELDPMARRYARSRARDEAVRQGLEPLAPGERPRVVTVAAIVAFAFAIANVVATLTVDDLGGAQRQPDDGRDRDDRRSCCSRAAACSPRKYWAVLGFQCILGLQIIVLSLAFTRVQKWWIALCLVVVVGLLG